MGLADLPRLYFNGFNFWSPSTFNNNDDYPTYDVPHVRLDWAWLRSQGVETTEQFWDWAIQPKQNQPNQDGRTETVPPAEWNYHGGNDSGFVAGDAPSIEDPAHFSKPVDGTKITGFSGRRGRYRSLGEGRRRGLGGLPVCFDVGGSPAKLVDVDPTAFWSSQLFADTFHVGSAAAGAGFGGPVAGRAHSRWIHLSRNYDTKRDFIITGPFGCMWQTALRKETLDWYGESPGRGPAHRLRQVLEEPDCIGLMVRFVSYETIYFQGRAFVDAHGQGTGGGQDSVSLGMEEMIRLYAAYRDARAAWDRGETTDRPPPPVNRAYSRTVGWIAPWRRGELVSMASGRTLLADDPSRPGQLHTVTPSAPGDLAAVPLGPAEVAVRTRKGRLDGISVDLGSAVPEVDAQTLALTGGLSANTGTGAKADFGTLRLSLAPALGPLGDPSTWTAVASLPYARYRKERYAETAGVVDLDVEELAEGVDLEALRSGRFVLSVAAGEGDNGATALVEAATTAQTDDRGVYVEEPDAPWGSGPTPTLTIQVRHLGGKPPPGTRLGIGQYLGIPGGASTWQRAVVGHPKRPAPGVEILPPAALHPAALPGGAGITVDVPFVDDGRPFAELTVGLRGLQPSMPILAFFPAAPGETPVAPGGLSSPSVTGAFYAVARTLPFHNERAVAFQRWLRSKPDIIEANERVFVDVFETFHLLYPVMSFIGDAMRFQGWRGRIMELTDPAAFDQAAYMPVMRNLSAGQRRILELWSSYLDGRPAAGRRLAQVGR